MSLIQSALIGLEYLPGTQPNRLGFDAEPAYLTLIDLPEGAEERIAFSVKEEVNTLLGWRNLSKQRLFVLEYSMPKECKVRSNEEDPFNEKYR